MKKAVWGSGNGRESGGGEYAGGWASGLAPPPHRAPSRRPPHPFHFPTEGRVLGSASVSEPTCIKTSIRHGAKGEKQTQLFHNYFFHND